MIVTFRTQPQGNTSDVSGAYINFLRCVTAIMTASAGTTELTVNPYTASNTINTAFNCIVSIDSNTEAGGWTTSSRHAVPSSGTNTPAAYNAITAADYTYVADFYKSSGKTDESCTYLKMCFHTYNTFAGNGTTWQYATGENTRNHFSRTSITAAAGANMLITYGHSSSTDWTDTAFPPPTGNTAFNLTAQAKSHTYNSDFSSTVANMGPGLCYKDTTVQYKMAVAADYCIIWEEQIGVSHETGQWTTTTTGAGTTLWNLARFGSIFYMGTRDPQLWEMSRNDNPYWIGWQHTANPTSTGHITNPYAPDAIVAWMAYQNNTNTVTAPNKLYTVNTLNNPRCNQSELNPPALLPGNEGANGKGGQILDRFLKTRQWNHLSSSNAGSLGNSPEIDPVTGTNVPGAYPMVVSSSQYSYRNAGGKIRGLYKSLSMPYADIKLYWQSSDQTFTIDGEIWMPFAINSQDMWLVRKA